MGNLQDALLLLLDRGIYQLNEGEQRTHVEKLRPERERSFYGEVTRQLVETFQKMNRLEPRGRVDETTANALNKMLEEWGMLGEATSEARYLVEGKIGSRASAGTGGLRVVIVDKGVGGDAVLGETVSDVVGNYQATFAGSVVGRRAKTQPDLQARVFINETFLGASEVRYNATPKETLDVLLEEASATALPSEHEVLTSALSSHFEGHLRDLKEEDEQQDITYLANKTGWDARAVAMAALADQFSARTAVGHEKPIPQPFFYALFRAGLPAEEDSLYHTDAASLESVWKKGVEQGVIPKAAADQIPEIAKRFQALNAKKLLGRPAEVGTSSFKELLAVSHLDDAQQTKFAQLFATHQSDMPKFWESIGRTLGHETADRLQLDGKLSFLTINNSSLMMALHKTVGDGALKDPLQLAQQGFADAPAWHGLLGETVAIPKEIPGETPETQRANYADYLAAQVRLSYPTASIAYLVKNWDFPLKDAPEGALDKVHAFLTEHQGKFELGMQPVQQFVARNSLTVDAETLKQVVRLQRVHQITPSDQAMTALMKHGLDSAQKIVSYDKETFLRLYEQDLGGPKWAVQTYNRSLQVHNAVLNIAVSYLAAKNGIELGAQTLGPAVAGADFKGQLLRPIPLGPAAPNAADVIAYPTLEGLFGSMDFCACDHCRSILSPAAYLVDLLHLIDKPEAVNGENPQSVLLERRPDIQHLPLTCENTNTALPYIDVVNETLEYFVANTVQKNSLTDYAGHDTGDVSSEDLLASPQYAMDEAYSVLRKAQFPSPLPFHQPLENLRRCFDKFGIPLPQVMEKLRKSEDLERGTNAYGWRDILMEEIGTSREEYEILTDSAAVPLWQMYGFSDNPRMIRFLHESSMDAHAINALSNAKEYSRRVGISYEDLIAILRTRFVNPNADLIPKLERLGLPFATLNAFKRGTITDADFDAMLPQGVVAPDPAQYGGNMRGWLGNKANFAKLEGLRVPLPILNAFKNGTIADADLEAMLPQGVLAPDPGQYGGDIKGWLRNDANFARIMALITLTDPQGREDGCDFGVFEFRFSKPVTDADDKSTRLGAAEFVRLLRFIRLWKKMGWTIEQTDAAICALFREDLGELEASDLDTVSKLDTGFLVLLPRLGIVVRTLKALNLKPKRDLQPLLACWAPIGTRGDGALYREMFLNPAMLKQDPIFADNGYGDFMQKAAVPYVQSQPALDQAILDAAQGKIGYDSTDHRLTYSTVLDVATLDALKGIAGVDGAFPTAVDALYRSQRLAAHSEALRSAFNLTGDEYAQITTALGYDADTPLTNPNISAIYRAGWLARKLKLSIREFLSLTKLTGLDPFTAPDATAPAILRLIALVQALKECSFKTTEALYLIWNEDLSGRSAPDPAQVTELARSLRGDFAAIEAELAVTEDPGGDLARAKMALVYGQEAADAFFALLDGTVILDVSYTHAELGLGEEIRNADPQIDYDGFRHLLLHNGLLGLETRDALKNAPGVTLEFQNAVEALFNRGEDARESFLGRHPELRSLFETYVASSDPADTKRSALLAAFRPELTRRRKRQQTLQNFAAAAAADLPFTQAILDAPVAPFPLHASGKADEPVLNDLMNVETPGLLAQFYFRETATGLIDAQATVVPAVDYAVSSANPLPASPEGKPISGVWQGKVETPDAGFYNFILETDAGAVRLKLDGTDRPLTQNGATWRNLEPLELAAGALHDLEVTVEKVKDRVRVMWETPARSREVIPARYFYLSATLEQFSIAYIRFLKAASLAALLRLTADELTFFATNNDYAISGDGWLNKLPVYGEAAPKTAIALLKPLQTLLDYVRVRTALSLKDDSLLGILRDPENAADAFLTSARWDRTSLTELLPHFGYDLSSLAHFDQFQKIYDAFGLVRKMGIPAAVLIQATTNIPTGETARGLLAALRARYDTASWREVIQPINDAMRGLQRDALVAFILHQMRLNRKTAHIDTPDKLFEYFLMDVQMEPCMQTSRIRHALSSAQLFIERCLMNLEPRVSPAALDSKQWEWMKRYRVWEANRKVFLWPENWLEPELRDNKSPFFKEIESELLQSDITEASATTALLNYLSKLEEVAKLEPCGIHYVEDDPETDAKDDVSHVVARTAGAKRKYYYRRREYGYWTPWEHIKLDIDANPVIPVVWKDRLLLFWLRLLQKGADGVSIPLKGDADLATLSGSDIDTTPPEVIVQALLCWSEYYNGKWQPTKTSSVDNPPTLGTYNLTAFDRSAFALSVGMENAALYLRIEGQGDSWFMLFNTHSLPSSCQEDDDPWPDSTIHFQRTFDTSQQTLIALYRNTNVSSPITRSILSNELPYNIISPTHGLSNPWDAPFFYEDSRHVFFVETSRAPLQIWKLPYPGKAPTDDWSKRGIRPILVNEPWRKFEFKRFSEDRRFDPSEPITNQPRARLITEDGYIHRVIGTDKTVTYGNKQIGPTGQAPI